MNDLKKLEYVSPKVCSFLIEMEQGIATGSLKGIASKFRWAGSGRMDTGSG